MTTRTLTKRNRPTSQRGYAPSPEQRREEYQRRSRRNGNKKTKRPDTWLVGFSTWRFSFLAIVVVAVVAVVIYRLAGLQLQENERLVNYARSQRQYTAVLTPDRGAILDRNGKPLATSLPSISFAVHPKDLVDPEMAAKRLAPVVGISETKLLEQFTSGTPFVWLARQTTDSKAAEIRALDVGKLQEIEEPRRFLPAGNQFARSIIGNVFEDSGQSGAEKIFEEQLAGQSGSYQVDRTGFGLPLPGTVENRKPMVQGSSVLLSIDHVLQHEVETILAKEVENSGSKGGVAVVSDPRTGEILASVSLSRDEEGEIYHDSLNKATSWIFEPGSVMKAVTFAGVLDSGIANPDSSMVVDDTYHLYDEVFTDSSGHEPTNWSVKDIVTVSSNVGTIRWAERLGSRRLDSYLEGFGFGTSSGLGFTGETPGLMPNDDNWAGIGIATTSLGQGISVTPLQMLGAYNAIANDGVYLPPTILREQLHADGTREVPEVPSGHQVISVQSALQMRSILQNVVDVGTGTNAQVEGYRVAGKTGTARKAQEGGGYLDADGNYQYVASFIGFLPVEDPALSILVTLDEPSSSIYAGQVAAPAFSDIAAFGVRHLRIAPPAEITVNSPGVGAKTAPLMVSGASERVVTTAPVEAPVIPTTVPVEAPADLSVRAASNGFSSSDLDLNGSQDQDQGQDQGQGSLGTGATAGALGDG